jgi:isoamylase
MMKYLKAMATWLVCTSLLMVAVESVHASINSMNLGANYDSQQTQITFRVYSASATHMELYLYAKGYGAQEKAKYVLDNDGHGVWQVIVPVSFIQALGVSGPVYYGYRAWGPNWLYAPTWTKGSSVGFISDVDSNGNRFNPNKILIDPYAREISQDPINATNQNGNIFNTGATVDSSFGKAYRLIDSGPYASKGIVLAPSTQSTGTKPTRAQKDDVIYEVHVRGLTKQDPSIPSQYQGTYYGAGLKAKSLASLGVTAVEFLPVQETQNDANDVENDAKTDPSLYTNDGQNYWGYSTEDFFAPDRRYAYDKTAGGPTKEFQAMVKAFHDEGIKVYMDVVYNHTSEGGVGSDPMTAMVLSWRGLDNATYYELNNSNQGYFDGTGVGNTFNTYNTIAQDQIIDSLAYWTNTMGVDGYRFDEGPILGNSCLNGASIINVPNTQNAPNCPNGGFNFDASDQNVAINRITKELTIRSPIGGGGIDLYAESSAMASGNEQGGFPANWSTWNLDFKGTMTQALNWPHDNDKGFTAPGIGHIADLLTGSEHTYPAANQSEESPWNATNYVDIHDGLTLNDRFSCNGAWGTQDWPFGPSDGGGNDGGWDQGMSKGTGTDEDQRRAARTGLAFVMLSAGTPMMQGGDEHLRTLQCNSNAYNLDSPGNWLNYTWTNDQKNFYTFAQRLIKFRLAHPAFRPKTWYTNEQVVWYEPGGTVVDGNYWNDSSNHAIAYMINGTTLPDGTTLGDTNSFYIAFNGWSGNVSFTLPAPPNGTRWYRVTDTCNWNDGADTFAAPGKEYELEERDSSYGQCGLSLSLFIAK